MNYALQLSAQGALTALYRSDVIANNLANYATDGFKPDVPVVRARDVVREEDGLGYLPSNVLLEQLGGGPHMAPNYINFTQGPIETTDRPFDLAITGQGFFQVGTGPDNQMRLSRDGRLDIDAQGRLVQAATGHRLLDDRQRAIHVSPTAGPIDVDPDGLIRQAGLPVAQFALVDLPDRRGLEREGSGMFKVPANRLDTLMRAQGRVLHKAVEKSSVNEITTLKDLTDAFGAVSANTRMMSYADEMLDRAINRLGRVA